MNISRIVLNSFKKLKWVLISNLIIGAVFCLVFFVSLPALISVEDSNVKYSELIGVNASEKKDEKLQFKGSYGNFLKVLGNRKSEVFYKKKLKMTVITFDESLVNIYEPKDAKTLSEISNDSGYRYLFNGSFFGGNGERFEHAGLLQINGKVITPLRKRKIERQLTHIVILKRSGEIKLIPQRKYRVKRCKMCTAFQTGPLVIKDNIIKRKLIKRSYNGSLPKRRTLFGFTKDGRQFIFTVRKEITLTSLAKKVLSMKRFRGKKLSLINLDGGSSVAMFSRDFPEYNFNLRKKLPIVVGIRSE